MRKQDRPQSKKDRRKSIAISAEWSSKKIEWHLKVLKEKNFNVALYMQWKYSSKINYIERYKNWQNFLIADLNKKCLRKFF